MLISQVTYLGPLLSPSAAIISKMQACIDNYVMRGIPVAADRKYCKPSKGGLGLINIADLFDSFKCSWYKRILQDGINDYWGLSLSRNCFNNILCFRPDQLNVIDKPVEHAIGLGFWTSCRNFGKLIIIF